MNHDGEITLLLPLMAEKKGINDIGSFPLENIQTTGIPFPYSPITTRGIRLKLYKLMLCVVYCILCHVQKSLAYSNI